MKISTLHLLLKDASKNPRNNATTSIASITTIISILFILGLFVLFMLNLKMGINGIVLTTIESILGIKKFLIV